MRHSLTTGMSLAGLAALVAMSGPQIEPYSGSRPVKRIRRSNAKHKPTRAADRSKKQFLIKGVRP